MIRDHHLQHVHLQHVEQLRQHAAAYACMSGAIFIRFDRAPTTSTILTGGSREPGPASP
jgi:hypothetical protein